MVLSLFYRWENWGIKQLSKMTRGKCSNEQPRAGVHTGGVAQIWAPGGTQPSLPTLGWATCSFTVRLSCLRFSPAQPCQQLGSLYLKQVAGAWGWRWMCSNQLCALRSLLQGPFLKSLLAPQSPIILSLHCLMASTALAIIFKLSWFSLIPAAYIYWVPTMCPAQYKCWGYRGKQNVQPPGIDILCGK